ncbi:MAG: hypothetical protein AAB855_02600, partial [Patescibacteria group bacterium]
TAMVMPRDGLEVVLTLDTTIQYIAERALQEGFEKSRAKGACSVVSDHSTGEIHIKSSHREKRRFRSRLFATST